MNLNDAFTGIYDSLNPLPSKDAFLSNEILFHGIHENKKKQIIKNQQLQNYHMYRNKLPWELNKNAGEMFNGHNSQLGSNEYRTLAYRDQKHLNPNYYDQKNYGQFDTEHRLPTPLDNDKFYQYHTSKESQGQPQIYDIRMNESRNYKSRRSQRSQYDTDRQNNDLQNHFFTPMGGVQLQPAEKMFEQWDGR